MRRWPACRRTSSCAKEDNAAVGVYLSSTGNARDTVGVFVQSVVAGGPAEKAGLVEGDRIASINGVDVREPRGDVGDCNVASSRIDRLEREVRKRKPGQAAELVIVASGRSRIVKVTATKASDLPATRGSASNVGWRIRRSGPEWRPACRRACAAFARRCRSCVASSRPCHGGAR